MFDLEKMPEFMGFSFTFHTKELYGTCKLQKLLYILFDSTSTPNTFPKIRSRCEVLIYIFCCCFFCNTSQLKLNC